MSTKPKSKTPVPIVGDPELEAQMKTAAETLTPAQTEALTVIGDARVEQIKKSNGQGDRLAIRATNGQFTKAATAIAKKDARQAAEFLMEKVTNAAGVELSRKQHIREALYDAVVTLAANPKGVMGAVRAAEFLNDDAALPQAKEVMLASANQEVQNPVRVVLINGPVLMHPEITDFAEEQRKKKERDAKGPSFAEVTGHSTNPAPERT